MRSINSVDDDDTIEPAAAVVDNSEQLDDGDDEMHV